MGNRKKIKISTRPRSPSQPLDRRARGAVDAFPALVGTLLLMAHVPPS
jgi:hypothetical protein